MSDCVVIGDATLYCGDCRAIWPTLKNVDAVISDPPYGISYKGGTISSKSISTTRKQFSEKIVGDDEPFDPSQWLLAASVALTGAQHYAKRLPDSGSFHVWNKRGPYEPIDQSDGDLVWINRKTPLRILNMVWRGICRQVEHTQRIEHPTQKPVALMEWCITMARVPHGGVILDPYMGSGSTLVASINMGHPCIGIEIERRFFDVACERLVLAQRQPVLFMRSYEHHKDEQLEIAA